MDRVVKALDPSGVLGEMMADLMLQLAQRQVESERRCWQSLHRIAEANENEHSISVDYGNSSILVYEKEVDDEV